MPELPEVESVCRELGDKLAGKIITSITVRNRKLRWEISTDFEENVVNTKLLSISRRAKYIVWNLDKGTVLIHLGMSGSLNFTNDLVNYKKHDHIEFILNNELILRYNDPRRFGFINYISENPLNSPLLTNLGIEPFSEDFSASYLIDKLSKRKNISIKQALMDNKIVVGIGNIYANEALFLAKINPARSVASISLNEAKNIVKYSKIILQKSIERGGTTLRDYVTPNGKLGSFRNELKVYERENLQCTVCKEKIRSIKLGQRSSYFCCNCQN
jgi:formamidopyrimidine-DNA glycosylase